MVDLPVVPDKKTLRVDVDEELYGRLKEAAEEQGVSLSELVRVTLELTIPE